MVLYRSCPRGRLKNAKMKINLKENEKSFLTNVSLRGIIKKLRDEKRELGAQRHGSKNFEKNRKSS